MDEKIILNELYDLDPELKQHEQMLIKLIKELLAAQPEAKMDPVFRERLRSEIMQRIKLMKEENKTTGMFSMKKFEFALGGMVLAIVLITAAYFGSGANKRNNVELALNDTPSFVSKSEKAFGSLMDLGSSRDYQAGSAGMSMGIGGTGGGGDFAGVPAPDSGAGLASETKIYNPEGPRFAYTGDADIKIDADAMAVLSRIKYQATSVSESLLRSFNFGLANIASFKNTKLDNVTFSEDKEFGYTISVSLSEGTMYINQNWSKWPQPAALCRDQQCYENLRINISEVKDDSRYIEIANRFLADHGISRNSYSQPEVRNEWRIAYEATADKQSYYIPESVTVVYPLILNGEKIYDESGSPVGINVSIGIRDERVMSVWELNSQKYETSEYQTEKDFQKILSVALKGGFRSYYGESGSSAPVIELGTPNIAYVRTWIGGQNPKEIYVPAMIFPVIKAPEQYSYTRNVVVPIVKDILDNPSYDGPIHIMK